MIRHQPAGRGNTARIIQNAIYQLNVNELAILGEKTYDQFYLGLKSTKSHKSWESPVYHGSIDSDWAVLIDGPTPIIELYIRLSTKFCLIAESRLEPGQSTLLLRESADPDKKVGLLTYELRIKESTQYANSEFSLFNLQTPRSPRMHKPPQNRQDGSQSEFSTERVAFEGDISVMNEITRIGLGMRKDKKMQEHPAQQNHSEFSDSFADLEFDKNRCDESMSFIEDLINTIPGQDKDRAPKEPQLPKVKEQNSESQEYYTTAEKWYLNQFNKKQQKKTEHNIFEAPRKSQILDPTLEQVYYFDNEVDTASLVKQMSKICIRGADSSLDSIMVRCSTSSQVKDICRLSRKDKKPWTHWSNTLLLPNDGAFLIECQSQIGLVKGCIGSEEIKAGFCHLFDSRGSVKNTLHFQCKTIANLTVQTISAQELNQHSTKNTSTMLTKDANKQKGDYQMTFLYGQQDKARFQPISSPEYPIDRILSHPKQVNKNINNNQIVNQLNKQESEDRRQSANHKLQQNAKPKVQKGQEIKQIPNKQAQAINKNQQKPINRQILSLKKMLKEALDEEENKNKLETGKDKNGPHQSKPNSSKQAYIEDNLLGNQKIAKRQKLEIKLVADDVTLPKNAQGTDSKHGQIINEQKNNNKPITTKNSPNRFFRQDQSQQMNNTSNDLKSNVKRARMKKFQLQLDEAAHSSLAQMKQANQKQAQERVNLHIGMPTLTRNAPLQHDNSEVDVDISMATKSVRNRDNYSVSELARPVFFNLEAVEVEPNSIRRTQLYSKEKSERSYERNHDNVSFISKTQSKKKLNKDSINFKISSIVVDLNKQNPHGKIAKIQIGDSVFITETSFNKKYLSWKGQGYFFPSIPTKSILTLTLLQDNQGAKSQIGACKIHLFLLKNTTPNEVTLYEDFLRSDTDDPIGKVLLNYQFIKHKHNNPYLQDKIRQISQRSHTKMQKHRQSELSVTPKNKKASILKKDRVSTEPSIIGSGEYSRALKKICIQLGTREQSLHEHSDQRLKYGHPGLKRKYQGGNILIPRARRFENSPSTMQPGPGSYEIGSSFDRHAPPL